MSFLAHANPEYGWKEKLTKLDAQAYMNFRVRVGPDTRAKLPVSAVNFDQDEFKHISFYDMLVDSDEIEAWNEVGVEMHIKRIKGVHSNDANPAKAIYQVSVANVGLMNVQRVDVLEDGCTNELQRWLDRGWRIIAVCPPNDTRRPAYVMGHFEKESS